ncbi:hypothetical protein DF156_07545 [Burkholderia ubonensis]|nr:hypothetical protein CJO66_03865 [Burkholderia ubonensis]RQP38913.1 hypothetical protein DF155_07890 [Burkholderia ubonensis]RQP39219.1 hypothetical protein DF154_15665 [Burkholderia ubonensis]RQP44711.1 hypothetical protein DF156_07545 [Burkholderia ubonensis]RQP58333.1 hypothetical protein DF144_07595 [Burkholderia ubonensis]
MRRAPHECADLARDRPARFPRERRLSVQPLDQDGWTHGFVPRYTGRLNVGGMRNDLIVGARFFGGLTHANQYVNNRKAKSLRGIGEQPVCGIRPAKEPPADCRIDSAAAE